LVLVFVTAKAEDTPAEAMPISNTGLYSLASANKRKKYLLQETWKWAGVVTLGLPV